MAGSDSHKSERPYYLGVRSEGSTVALGCGCLSLLRDGRFEIDWCPHHATMHGTTIVSGRKSAPEPTLH
jgi:hypothetical protein